jgi:malonyl-CoA O-methyltransferase
LKIETAYTRWSASYDEDRNLTRDLDQSVTETILRPRRFEAALELGCGTGKNTALLARICRTVLALDFAEAMLRRAKEKVRADNVSFARADLTRPWPCPNAAFDLVACNLVLEHINDLDIVFAEAARCTASKALVFVSELHPYRQYKGTQARYTDQRDGEIKVPAFIHHISDFVHSAQRAGLTLDGFTEWSHPEDDGGLPRLAVFELTSRQRP